MFSQINYNYNKISQSYLFFYIRLYVFYLLKYLLKYLLTYKNKTINKIEFSLSILIKSVCSMKLHWHFQEKDLGSNLGLYHA